jgi:hypothetical protein
MPIQCTYTQVSGDQRWTVSPFSDTGRVQVFEDIVVLDIIWAYIQCKPLHTLVKLPWYQYGIDLGYAQMLSSCDTHQVSVYEWYYNIGIMRVGSLISLLMLYIYTMHSPLYQSNFGVD